jgi:hypothetical protein
VSVLFRYIAIIFVLCSKCVHADMGGAHAKALTQPSFVAAIKAPLLDADGAVRHATAPRGHPYLQRLGLNAVLQGLASNDDAQVAAGVRALAVPFEAKTLGLARFADSLAFLGAWARAAALLQTVKHKDAGALLKYRDAVRERLAEKPLLTDMAQWQSGFKTEPPQANQLLWAALDAQSIAELLNDSEWAKRAAAWEARALALQGTDGVFAEKRADPKSAANNTAASYQAASLDRLLWLGLADSSLPATANSRARNKALASGMKWLAGEMSRKCEASEASGAPYSALFALWLVHDATDAAKRLAAQVQRACEPRKK